eukprot:TRINITY_DN11348_c0_g1_i4.p1 TRINITY_DN11348_c0_g1~~TRINITY_DN11348_c0_g1_i4.p1  ORF type:complete len:155 (-),score=33.44 TRINITY_DN11348_c0_g1_i4:44-508(-)
MCIRDSHKQLLNNLRELNEELILKKTQGAQGRIRWVKFLAYSVLKKPWRIFEVLRLLRPLILISSILIRKKMDSLTLLTGFTIDLASLLALKLKAEELSPLENSAFKERALGLFRYIMYSPLQEALLERVGKIFGQKSFVVAMLSYYRYYSLIL